MEIKNLEEKMNNAITFFEKELSSIRTSRASPSMIENIYIDSYGTKMPLNQIGNIAVPDSSTLTIQVWDASLIKNVESAIIESNLGVNPQTDGTLIRLPIPKLSEERRIELSKIASQYAENSKISIRNIRRDFLDELKKEEKDKLISQDDLKKQSSQIQSFTDDFIKKIDNIAENKKIDITKV